MEAKIVSGSFFQAGLDLLDKVAEGRAENWKGEEGAVFSREPGSPPRDAPALRVCISPHVLSFL